MIRNVKTCRWSKAGVTWVFALLLVVSAGGGVCQACFSIVVGKNASTDGCVIVAHNEDDTAPQIVNHHKVPRHNYPPGSKVTLRNGGSLEQVQQTWAYLWSEIPGLSFSDSYVNEWGVTVASDNCPSREDRPELTEGGIGYMLRRLVAERAKTAREGVLLAGELVAKAPEHVPALVIKMLVSREDGNKAAAQDYARRVLRLTKVPSAAHRAASRILGVDPNTPADYKESIGPK